VVPEIDRRLLIAAPIVVIVVFLLGFALGRGTSSSGDSAALDGTTVTVIAALGDQDGSDTSAAQGEDSTAGSTTINGDASVVLPSPPPELGAIPQYGSEDDRNAIITGLVEAGVSSGSRDDILATADYVCYTLERLRAQGRSLSFAVRVVWNDSLAALAPEDLSAFGTVLSAAPPYLCPENAEFGERISYWLGY